jgi:uncharacterized membrane protein (DUF485 family)
MILLLIYTLLVIASFFSIRWLNTQDTNYSNRIGIIVGVCASLLPIVQLMFIGFFVLEYSSKGMKDSKLNEWYNGL